MSGGDFWGAQPVEVKRTLADSLSARCHAIVGTALTVLTRPAGHRCLAFQILSDGFFIKQGKHLDKRVSKHNINGGDDTWGAFAHGFVAGDGPYRLRVEQAEKTTGDLTFDQVPAADDTLTRSAGSWLTDGFVAGQVITVASSASNDGTYTILAASALVLTFAGDVLTDEGPTGAPTVLGPVPSDADLPAGLDGDTDYWVDSFSDNTFSFHPTHKDGLAGTNKIDITNSGLGGRYVVAHMPSGTKPEATETDKGLEAMTLLTANAKDDVRVIAAGSQVTFRGNASGSKLVYWWLP